MKAHERQSSHYKTANAGHGYSFYFQTTRCPYTPGSSRVYQESCLLGAIYTIKQVQRIIWLPVCPLYIIDLTEDPELLGSEVLEEGDKSAIDRLGHAFRTI